MRGTLALWLLLGLSQLTAQAVCLNGHPSVTREFRQSRLVVLATVVSQAKTPASRDGYFFDGTTYRVRIETRFKGVDSNTLTLFSENSTGRFDMAVGEKYLLFVHLEHGRLSVDNCGNSKLASKSPSDVAQVKKLASPVQ